jgi:hypothetical protein
MSKAVAIYTGGITERREVAVRDDGMVFRRCQDKGRYGYFWTKWTTSTQRIDVGQLPDVLFGLRRATPDDCFINNRAKFNDKGQLRVRLP